MKLTNNSRVAIVGGGPAGSLTAFAILDLAERLGISLSLDLYEPRAFYRTGPPGCNMCGGIISESLVELLATEGIHLPSNVIIDTIDTYILHTNSGSVSIRSHLDEMRIACIYRGGGPKGAENQRPLPWDSFDWFLLQQALKKGAVHIPHRVRDLSWDADQRPQVYFDGHNPRTYDLLVGAVGLHRPSLELFENMGFGYRPPKTTKAFVAEFYYGHQQVQKLLGNAMNVFLLDIPGLKFAALTPKGDYATFIILGDGINKALINKVLRSPQLQGCFPLGWEIPVQPCQCHPQIHFGDATNYYSDRVVMVGDCAVSRLYKDGIGAAYRMAKACANTVVTNGTSRADFKRFYQPTCTTMSRDNRLGHMLFTLDTVFRAVRPMREAMLAAIRSEQNKDHSKRPLSGALWDTFTGSGSYWEIVQRSMRPDVLFRLFGHAIKSLF
ncbi:MAG: hypothetical protein HQL54_09825 [Magnetococcales bacterium]|nr:hypothetical protein [Magnetococcales bacterium]